MPRNEAVPISKWLLAPWLDRGAAVFIAGLSAFWIYRHNAQVSLFSILFLVSQIQIMVNMLARRAATRIETNPWVLLLSLLRLFWPLLVFTSGTQDSLQLVNAEISNGISCVLFALIIFSRFSLGRSLGCFPADRKIVTTGAYGIVRHPIQALEVLFFINFFLSNTSLKTGALAALGTVIYYLKSEAEERFHSHDEEYRNYRETVRYRFIPFVI